MRRLACLLALVLGVALAQGDLKDGFSLPSGRLQCQFVPAAEGGTLLRCDVLNPTFRAPPRPADCPLAWGDSLYLEASGRPGFTCHGDTVVAQRPVLAYGQTWRQGGFACTSSPTGVRCTNASGHGFTLARAKYSLF